MLCSHVSPDDKATSQGLAPSTLASTLPGKRRERQKAKEGEKKNMPQVLIYELTLSLSRAASETERKGSLNTTRLHAQSQIVDRIRFKRCNLEYDI